MWQKKIVHINISNFSLQGRNDMDMHHLTDIFCQIDDFCNRLDDYSEDYMLTGPMKSKRGPECGLAISEIMTILPTFPRSLSSNSIYFLRGRFQNATIKTENIIYLLNPKIRGWANYYAHVCAKQTLPYRRLGPCDAKVSCTVLMGAPLGNEWMLTRPADGSISN